MKRYQKTGINRYIIVVQFIRATPIPAGEIKETGVRLLNQADSQHRSYDFTIRTESAIGRTFFSE